MEFIFEFLVELALEGVSEASRCSRIPKFVRYPLIGLTVLFYAGIIGLILFTGFRILGESLLGGVVLILLGVGFAVMCISAFRRAYLTKVKK